VLLQEEKKETAVKRLFKVLPVFVCKKRYIPEPIHNIRKFTPYVCYSVRLENMCKSIMETYLATG
jgi:hypothetical protein